MQMLLDFFDPTIPLTLPMFLLVTGTLFLIQVGSYFSTAVPLYYLFTKNTDHKHIDLQSRTASPAQIRDEIKWSMISVTLYTAMSMLLLLLWRSGYFSNLYLLPWERGWGYFFLNIIMLVIVQDCLFYFTHRALHTKALARFHAIHHRSKAPTPFALYSFHPVEGMLHLIRIPVVLILFPVNLIALLISEGIFSNFVNAYGHLNVEPHRLPKPLRWLHPRCAATSTFHNLHHSKGNGNYGFYLRIWDDKLGTLFPETDQTLNRLQQAWNKEDDNSKKYAT